MDSCLETNTHLRLEWVEGGMYLMIKLAVFIRDCGNELLHNGDYLFRSQLSCSDCWLAKVAQNLNAELGACWDVLIQDWILSAAPLPIFLNIEINVDLLRIVFDGAARLALVDALLGRLRELGCHAAMSGYFIFAGSRSQPSPPPPKFKIIII